MKRQNLIIYLLAIILGLILGFRSPGTKIDYLLSRASKGSMNTYNGWRTNLTIGQDSQSTLTRSVVARVGLGANTKDEAIYLTATKDKNGERLNSANEYQIIIEEEVPVEAFWSITLYGEDDYLIKNEFNKHAVSSFHKLIRQEDGSIVILLSKEQPANPQNWIPLPKNDQNLTLTLRCYQPKEALKYNIESVQLPVIEKVVNDYI